MIETIESARGAAVLMEALTSVFADFGYIDVMPSRERFDAIPSPVRAVIDALKPVSCRIEIECPASLKERIESTIFAGEAEVQGDSLLEVLNVVAGAFLTGYFGPGADIKLELPQYLYFSDGSEGEKLAEVFADAEGSPIRAALRSIRYRY
jgi:hypothetical protein